MRPWALVTQLGVSMSLSIVSGLVAGIWIDNKLGTAPLATLICSLIGIAVGTFSVYRLVVSSIYSAEERDVDKKRRHSDRSSRGEND